MISCNFREKGKTITEQSSDQNPPLTEALAYPSSSLSFFFFMVLICHVHIMAVIPSTKLVSHSLP